MLALGFVAALLAALLVPSHARAAVNGYDVITEYPSSTSAPNSITTGADGSIWYTASTSSCSPAGCMGTSAFVKVDPSTGSTLNTYGLSNACIPYHLVTGADHNLWAAAACSFGADIVSSELIRVTTTGTITVFDLPSDPRTFGRAPGALIDGPDGYLWVVTYRNSLAEVDLASGTVHSEHPLPSGATINVGIAVGSDGNVWFTEPNRIGFMTTSGSITEFPLPRPNTTPVGITAGSDGNLYFLEGGFSTIGRITTGGVVTEFALPSGSMPGTMRVAADGNLWFTDTNKLGSMTSAGMVQEVSMPTATSQASSLAPGPDGNLWFVENTTNQIGKVGTRHNVLVLDKTGIGFARVPAGTTTTTQRITLTNSGPDMMAAFTPTVPSPGGSSGSFAVAADTCPSAALAAGSTCYVDVQFTSTMVTGTAAATLVFDVDAGRATEQTLTAGLSAVVVPAACIAAAITTDVTSPQAVGAVVTLVGSSTGCPHPNPLYLFYIRSPEGVWSTVQPFGTATSFVWNTATYERGTYQIGVIVRDANSPNSSDASGFASFTIALPGCSSTAVASNAASPQTVGISITFSASSIGCPSPLYQWWVRDPSGVWSIVPGHDFAHSTASFSWDTTALAEGTYQIGLWAKELGSVGSYDGYAITTYTLTVTHCSAVNLATSVASPQGAGSSITLTPTAVGCPGAQYRFWIRDGAGTWHIVQDYAVASTYNWTAGSTPVSTSSPGTFLVGVWARQPGSTNIYDSFAFGTFSLTSASACTVNIAADKTSPQGLGTPATWTATTNCCPNTPLSYQFWIDPPGGTWTIVQAFNSANAFAWTGVAAGTYQVGVWIKQPGSASSYDNFALTTFTLTPTNPAQVCQSVDVGAAPASPAAAGTTITFTASGATGCSSPEYRWWVGTQSGNWFLEQNYSASGNTFIWSTAGGGSTWFVGVWARQSGSNSSYEAYSFITYTLTAPATTQACSSANISASPASPQEAGWRITFSATSLGCTLPDYRFLVAPQGGSYSEVQPYGSPNTFVWYASQVPGLFLIAVWARQHGSTASYEAYALTSFQVPPNSCRTLALWPTDSGTTFNTVPIQAIQPAGTRIGWTSTYPGCGGEFQFLVQQPGSADKVAQSYAPALNNFQWDTAGLPLGTYRVTVQARIFGQPVPYEVLAISSFEVI